MPTGVERLKGRPEWAAAPNLDTVLFVAAVDTEGRAITDGTIADIAVPLTPEQLLLDPLGAETKGDAMVGAATAAALRLGALAARLVAVAPDLDGAALKARILVFGKPLPLPGGAKSGWIKDVWRIHRLE